MTRVRRRVPTIALVVVAVLMLGYWVVDRHVVFGPTVYVRNETAGLAWVGIDGLWGDGDDKISVPPWTSGMCATGTWTWHHHGGPASVENGTVLIRGVSEAGTEVPLAQFTAGKPLYVRIDPTGAMHTGERVPDNAPNCTQYAIRNGWEWHLGE